MNAGNLAKVLYDFIAVAVANREVLDFDDLPDETRAKLIRSMASVIAAKDAPKKRVRKAPTDRGIDFSSQVTDADAKKWSGDCGAASLKMIMLALGLADGWTVDRIQSRMGPCMGGQEHNLSGWDEICCVGQEMGAVMETGVGDWRHGDIILNNYSMLSNRVDKGYGGLHWMCIVADWGDTIECNDPDSVGEGSKGIQYSKAELVAAYNDAGRRYVRCRSIDTGPMVVNSSSGFVRLRDKPALDGNVLGEIKNGDILVASRLDGFFYAVTTSDGKTGFAHAAYLYPNKGTNAAPLPLDARVRDLFVKPDTGGLNVRSAPNTSATVVTQLADGVQMKGVPAGDGWFNVTLNDGTTGYCFGQYLIEGTAPKVEVAPIGPSLAEKFKPFRIGSHDFPDDSVWANLQRRGWVLITTLPGDQPPVARMQAHKANGGHIAVRINNDYGDTVPGNTNDFGAFGQHCAEWVAKCKDFIDILQIANEPDLEMKRVDPEHIAAAHNAVAEAVLRVAPNLLIAPAPISWYGFLAERGFSHPAQYATRLWKNIKPEYFTAYVAHSYDHSPDEPHRTFDDPLRDCGWGKNNIERQIAELKAFGKWPLPVLVGETNPCADSGNWPDGGGWVGRAAEYFRNLDPNIVGMCMFRWEKHEAYGRTWTWNKGNTVNDFRDADRRFQ